MEENQLITHKVSPEEFSVIFEETVDRIQRAGDKPYVTVKMQLGLLEQLSQFDFGKFLLTHQGFNGYWTNYMLTHPWNGRKTGKNNQGKIFNELEDFILNNAPGVLATQQRFEIFLKENQKAVHNGVKLACIPSGMMGELLYLDFQNIKDIKLVGIDYDRQALQDAEHLATEKGLLSFLELIQRDAWALNIENEFDLISSNGLNIYEKDDDKVTDLYQQFYKALEPGGKLVTSFLTYPPGFEEACEWDMKVVDENDLMLQRIILVDIINAKFNTYRSTDQTREQLKAAGFEEIDFIYDKARIFPTVVAKKA